METREEPKQRPQIAGYDTIRYLGAGGNGTVWVIRDEESGEEFVLKIIGYDESFRRIGAGHLNVHHEFLVHERGVVDSSEGPGIVMEYCPAGSAAAIVADRGPLSVGEVLTVIAPIAEALQFLHGQGLTHGDVNPRNILFTAEGKPKLGDFGNHAGRGETPESYGTNGFCAPEVAGGSEAGELEPARDIYSLAACTWYLLTGRSPALAMNRIPIGAMVPEVNDELAMLIEDGLAVDPSRRPEAGQFAQRIFAGGAASAVELGSAVEPEALKHMVTARQSRQKRKPLSWFKKLGTGAAQARPTPDNRREGIGQKRNRNPLGSPVLGGSGSQAGVRTKGGTGAQWARSHRIRSRAGRKLKLAVAGLLGIGLLAIGAVAAQSIDLPASQAGASKIKAPGAALPMPGQAASQDSNQNAHTGAKDAREEILLAAADLTLRRDQVLMGSETEALKGIHAQGSPSMGRDRDILTLMKRNELRLESLRTSLEDASVVALGSNGSAFVEATSRQNGYRYVDGSGNAVITAKDAERQTVRLEMRHDGKTWKIWDVHSVPDGQPNAG